MYSFRGSPQFINHIVEIAKIPVIETGAGNCHAYVDKEADLVKALEIVYNGKTQRPSVCNATKKVLVHKDIADSFLPRLIEKLGKAGVIFLTDLSRFTSFSGATISTEEDQQKSF